MNENVKKIIPTSGCAKCGKGDGCNQKVLRKILTEVSENRWMCDDCVEKEYLPNSLGY